MKNYIVSPKNKKSFVITNTYQSKDGTEVKTEEVYRRGAVEVELSDSQAKELENLEYFQSIDLEYGFLEYAQDCCSWDVVSDYDDDFDFDDLYDEDLYELVEHLISVVGPCELELNEPVSTPKVIPAKKGLA